MTVSTTLLYSKPKCRAAKMWRKILRCFAISTVYWVSVIQKTKTKREKSPTSKSPTFGNDKAVQRAKQNLFAKLRTAKLGLKL